MQSNTETQANENKFKQPQTNTSNCKQMYANINSSKSKRNCKQMQAKCNQTQKTQANRTKRKPSKYKQMQSSVSEVEQAQAHANTSKCKHM